MAQAFRKEIESVFREIEDLGAVSAVPDGETRLRQLLDRIPILRKEDPSDSDPYEVVVDVDRRVRIRSINDRAPPRLSSDDVKLVADHLLGLLGEAND